MDDDDLEEENFVGPFLLGTHFGPPDSNIIRFLRAKHSGKPIPPRILITDRPIYAPDSSYDFNADFDTNDEDELYYFTSLHNNNRHYGMSDEDADRVVGNGTWQYQMTYDVDNPYDASKLIGFKKIFAFMDRNSRYKGWVMHEFTLPDQKVWAVCRIKRTSCAAADAPGVDADAPGVDSSSITYIPAASYLKRKDW